MGTRDAREPIALPPAGERPAEWAFRPDLEGLRAVAILLVVLYHAAIGPFAGGFIGVDVFYVLSGFLITGILLRELRTTGRISLPAFYARRARRLLPAAALVLLVTLLASILLLPPLLVPGIAGDAAAAALYVANIRFAVQATDYFAAGQAPSPILHYWSLGVEEQFYLLWPAIVLLVAHRASRPTWRVGSAALLIGALSLGLSLWLTSADAPLAFYLLPARAWELGLGALLAIAGTWLRRVPGWAAAMGGWAGLGLIALAGIVVNDATPYPGLAALLPTAGAAFVVASGARPSAFAPARLLGQAVPRYLGRISYSLYLWHWPLLVLPALAAGTPLPLGERAGLVVVAVLLAALTQRFVEDPVRRGRLVGSVPRRNLAQAGALALSVALIAVGSGVIAGARLQSGGSASNAVANAQALERALNTLASQSPGAALIGGAASSGTPAPGASPSGAPLPSAPAPAAPTATPSAAPYLPATLDRPVPANLQPSLAAASQDYPESYLDRCHVEEGGHASRGTCLYGDLASKTTIALFGDSHALSWFPAVEGFAEREGWRMLSLTMSACTPADVDRLQLDPQADLHRMHGLAGPGDRTPDRDPAGSDPSHRHARHCPGRCVRTPIDGSGAHAGLEGRHGTHP